MTSARALLTPDVIAARIEDVRIELSAGSDRLDDLTRLSERLRMIVELTTARVIAGSEAGAVDRRKAEAVAVCSMTAEPGATDQRDILTRSREAEAEVKALREAQHTRRAILDGLRAQAFALSAELRSLSYGRSS